ncbi:MAG: xylose isomerase domain-containing protein TIM barrel [Candidatus Peregrinibacteria bacterium Greene0416_62]|nr:MAG: xylose isomerase domain-containing protein TIM barrel [Candidatus Peregrinibacteria bacterium Greene0416_62]TSC99409.1 MAG: xylose isomerase domain-containing protein TIM barrel [Candidatus Peregrinibacteria bacterium Greene1014_49]
MSTPAPKPSVTISCFSDEISANFRTQLEVTQALGLKHISIRSGDPAATGRSNNIMKWDEHEATVALRMLDEFGIKVAEFGSPIGKVKLRDQEDGTTNRYVEPNHYRDEVRRACDLAVRFGAKRMRGFSFYQPKGLNPDDFLTEAADQLSDVVAVCAKAGLIYGVELEANLVGDNGARLVQIAKIIGNDKLRLVADPANITCQNIRGGAVDSHQAMRPHLGWMHAKDYRIDPNATWKGHVDEDGLKNFVPFGTGDSDVGLLLALLAEDIPRLESELAALGVTDGVLVTLEPHLRGGGQFGGFSGTDGMGIALRALCKCLDRSSIGYDLLGYEQMKR